VKTLLSVAVVFTFVTGIVGFTAAQTSTTTTPPPATEKKADPKSDKMAKPATTTKTASGSVKTVAPDSLVVAGKEKGTEKEWTFALNATTKVKKAGKAAAAADLKEGDRVQVRYTEADGKATATAVTVSSATKKAANPCAAKTDMAKPEKKQ
jgi:hypothetical protein